MPFHPLSRLSSYLHIRSVDPIIFRSHFVLLIFSLYHSLSPPLHALTVAKINQNKINISAKRPDSVALHLLSLSSSQWGGVISVCVRGCLVAICSTSRPSAHSTPLICAQHPSNCEDRHEGILKTVAAGGRRGRSQYPLSAQVRHTTHIHVVSCHIIITPSLYLSRLNSFLYPHHTCIICTSTIRSGDPNASTSSPSSPPLHPPLLPLIPSRTQPAM
jgi:hypothetical protein